MRTTKGYAALSAEAPLTPYEFQRRDVGPHDIEIEILYCGVCHSDLHQARNEWQGTIYPCVPGHEIIGRVLGVGKQVARFKEGDIAGVGCMVDSCRQCENCQAGEEQYCDSGPIFTYNSPEKELGGIQTFGGYSKHLVVDQAYALQVRDTKNLASTAPLLCAGITTYSPLHHWNIKKGMKVGVVGLGGLGHMAVKLAKAMGNHVVLFSTSESKRQDGLRLGADEVVLSTQAHEMKAQKANFDFILNTVSAKHEIQPYMNLLRKSGTLTMVGAPEVPFQVSAFDLIMNRRNLAGSMIGGIQETQEALDFCAEHGVTSDIELINIQEINSAYERLLKSDVKYRFVIDMKSL